jgi:hypothetical protein
MGVQVRCDVVTLSLERTNTDDTHCPNFQSLLALLPSERRVVPVALLGLSVRVIWLRRGIGRLELGLERRNLAIKLLKALVDLLE